MDSESAGKAENININLVQRNVFMRADTFIGESLKVIVKAHFNLYLNNPQGPFLISAQQYRRILASYIFVAPIVKSISGYLFIV